eukprot:4236337-Prymnesium_polylepis.1
MGFAHWSTLLDDVSGCTEYTWNLFCLACMCTHEPYQSRDLTLWLCASAPHCYACSPERIACATMLCMFGRATRRER